MVHRFLMFLIFQMVLKLSIFPAYIQIWLVYLFGVAAPGVGEKQRAGSCHGVWIRSCYDVKHAYDDDIHPLFWALCRY